VLAIELEGLELLLSKILVAAEGRFKPGFPLWSQFY